MSHYIIT